MYYLITFSLMKQDIVLLSATFIKSRSRLPATNISSMPNKRRCVYYQVIL